MMPLASMMLSRRNRSSGGRVLKSFQAAALCRLLLGLSVAAGIAAPRAAAQEKMVSLRPRPDGMGDVIRAAGPNNASSVQFDTGNQIQYWGGSVLSETAQVYIIWYGTFDSGTSGIISTMVSSIGGSPYFNINAGYFDSSRNSVSNSLSMAGSVQNNYTRGNSLHSSDIGGIVSDAIAGGLPLVANGTYVVLTAGDVSVSGFGSAFCGYHSVKTISSVNVHYAFIGNPAPSHMNGCAQQATNSPNNNPGAD